MVDGRARLSSAGTVAIVLVTVGAPITLSTASELHAHQIVGTGAPITLSTELRPHEIAGPSSSVIDARVWAVRAAGAVPPTQDAMLTATSILDAMAAHGLVPDRIVADPDGGIAIYAFQRSQDESPTRYGRVLATNESEVIAACVAPREPATADAVWEVVVGLDSEPSNTVQRIHDFVRG